MATRPYICCHPSVLRHQLYSPFAPKHTHVKKNPACCVPQKKIGFSSIWPIALDEHDYIIAQNTEQQTSYLAHLLFAHYTRLITKKQPPLPLKFYSALRIACFFFKKDYSHQLRTIIETPLRSWKKQKNKGKSYV